MSYLHESRWWMRFLEPFGRCQEKSVEQQYREGVRYFDLRVKFDKDGKPYFCHGLTKYKLPAFYDVEHVLRFLNTCAYDDEEKVYVRLLLESFRSSERELFEQWANKQRESFRHLSFRFGYKHPWTLWGGNDWPGFNEVAKHFDKKWHILLTPKYWVFDQGFKIIQLESQGYTGICAQDFV